MIKVARSFTDKMAISLSLLCAVHCLILPVLLALLPSLSALSLDNEAFHAWLVVAVLPISAFGLLMGCRQHKRYQLLIFVAIGLTCLISAVLWGESLGEFGEKALTLFGAVVIAVGHFYNFKLCRQHQHCACPEGQVNSEIRKDNTLA